MTSKHAFRALYSVLKTGIQSGVGDVADQAFSRGLISEDVKSTVTSLLVNLNEGRRARVLLDAVYGKIKVDPGAYKQFASILDETPAFKYLAHRMRSKLSVMKKKKNRKLNRHQTRDSWLAIIIGLICLGIGVYLMVYSPDSLMLEKASVSAGAETKQNNTSRDLQKYEEHIQQNLPKSNSFFFGRDHDLEELRKYILINSTRLININGPPAFGKSTLAIQVARELMRDKQSGVFSIFRYVDTESTRQSFYLCSYGEVEDDVSTSNTDVRTQALLNKAEPDFSSSSSDEPNLCQWAREAKQRSILILDNCDHILNSNRRKMFLNILHNHLNTVTNLSIIVTSQERLSFLDEGFFSWHLKELAPSDSNLMLQHYVPKLSIQTADEFSSVVGYCPLALKVIGRLLQERGVENSGSLLNDLKEQPVGAISRVSRHEERFQKVMDVAYNYLDKQTKKCSRLLSLFPGSVDVKLEKQVLTPMIDSSCAYDVIQKSLAEETFIKDAARHKMHKLVRSYLRTFHPLHFTSRNWHMFNKTWIDHYSNYLKDTMKLFYDHKRLTDEELYTLFYLETHNIEHFGQLVALMSSEDSQLKENTALAVGFIIHENIVSVSNLVEWKAYLSYTNVHIFAKLCVYSSKKICASILWKSFVSVGRMCTQHYLESLSRLELLTNIFFSFNDHQSCSSLLNCNNLTPFMFEDTLSMVQEEVKTTNHSSERLLFDVVDKSITICKSSWLINCIMFLRNCLQTLENLTHSVGAILLKVLSIVFWLRWICINYGRDSPRRGLVQLIVRFVLKLFLDNFVLKLLLQNYIFGEFGLQLSDQDLLIIIGLLSQIFCYCSGVYLLSLSRNSYLRYICRMFVNNTLSILVLICTDHLYYQSYFSFLIHFIVSFMFEMLITSRTEEDTMLMITSMSDMYGLEIIIQNLSVRKLITILLHGFVRFFIMIIAFILVFNFIAAPVFLNIMLLFLKNILTLYTSLSSTISAIQPT